MTVRLRLSKHNRHCQRNNFCEVLIEAPTQPLLQSVIAALTHPQFDFHLHPRETNPAKLQRISGFDTAVAVLEPGKLARITFKGPPGCGKTAIRNHFYGVLLVSGLEQLVDLVEVQTEGEPVPVETP